MKKYRDAAIGVFSLYVVNVILQLVFLRFFSNVLFIFAMPLINLATLAGMVSMIRNRGRKVPKVSITSFGTSVTDSRQD